MPNILTPIFKDKFSKKQTEWFFSALMIFFFVSFGITSDSNKLKSKNKEESQTSEKKVEVVNVKKEETFETKQQEMGENKEVVLMPGDEVFLRYDNKSNEKIYIADTLENFNILKKSYEIKDSEARYELILNGNVIAVENGTKVRIMDYVDVSGSEKIRVLEGDNYNFTGYVPWSLLKKN